MNYCTYQRVTGLNFSNLNVLLSLNEAGFYLNREDPDELPHSAAFNHC